jgi:hypothetical protein
MVHALRKAADLLKPGGCLLEIHDLIDPPRIEIHYHDQYFYAGQLLSSTGLENQRQAEQAVDQVIHEGTFSSSQVQVFENFIRAESLAALDTWLAEDWESAYMTEDTRHQIMKLVSQFGENAEVVLRMNSRLNRLDPLHHQA